MAKSAAFREADVKRALKPALALGLTVSRYEIGADGQIVVYTARDSQSELSPLEAWKASREAG